jgi:hypothetical protein
MGIGLLNIFDVLIPAGIWSCDGIVVKVSTCGYMYEGVGEQDGDGSPADPGPRVSVRKPPLVFAGGVFGLRRRLWGLVAEVRLRSTFTAGLASRPARKREYRYGPCFSSRATSGAPRRLTVFCTRSRISTRWSYVKNCAYFGCNSCAGKGYVMESEQCQKVNVL